MDTKPCQKKKKARLKSTKEKDISNWFSTKWALFLLSIRMGEKTLKFDNIRVNKKEFHKSKQPVGFHLINAEQIVFSDKFKHSDSGFKYFIG